MKWTGSHNQCDICHASFKKWFVDGKTKMGPWGLMCEKCFRLHGIGLGLGRGQQYDAVTLEKIKG